MVTLEELEMEAWKHGIAVFYKELNSDRIKGLYCNKVILINSCLKTSREKACVLAEELGHHFTSVGIIVDTRDLGNCKQEWQARLWAYNRMFGLEGLIRAYEKGCREDYEYAEELNVTTQFLREALQCYQGKYGNSVTVGEYQLSFIPCFSVSKADEQ